MTIQGPSAKQEAALLLLALGLPEQTRPRIRTRLAAIGGLVGLWRAGSEALEGLIDEADAQRLEAILELVGRMLAPAKPPKQVESPSDVMAVLGPRVGLEARESFWVLLLDTQSRVLGLSRVAIGTLTACLVHPREVFAMAVRARAASLIVVHNHPSGDPKPSEDDLQLTARLAEAGEILGVPLLDHLVVGREGVVSIGAPPFKAPTEHANMFP